MFVSVSFPFIYFCVICFLFVTAVALLHAFCHTFDLAELALIWRNYLLKFVVTLLAVLANQPLSLLLVFWWYDFPNVTCLISEYTLLLLVKLTLLRQNSLTFFSETPLVMLVEKENMMVATAVGAAKQMEAIVVIGRSKWRRWRHATFSTQR